MKQKNAKDKIEEKRGVVGEQAVAEVQEEEVIQVFLILQQVNQQ